MGWASGSSLLCEILASIKTNVKSKKERDKIYPDLIRAFESEDCDTIEECLDDGEFEKAYYKLYPEYLPEEKDGED